MTTLLSSALASVPPSSSCSLLPCRPVVLLTTIGSGNLGERRSDSHIYTLSGALPPVLNFKAGGAKDLPPPERTDVDIGPGGLAFTISNLLSAEQADSLAAISESLGYSRFAPAIRTPPGMRMNSAAHWMASEEHAAQFLDPMFERIAHLLPKTVAGGKLYPKLSRRMAHYKYDDGDVFNRHTDGEWPGQGIAASAAAAVAEGATCSSSSSSSCSSSIEGGDGPIEEWQGVTSRLSMLLYLNDAATDGVRGGATRLFPFPGGVSGSSSNKRGPTDVQPAKGAALFFRHGFDDDSVVHMGTQVTGHVPKYVVRLNVLYEGE